MDIVYFITFIINCLFFSMIFFIEKETIVLKKKIKHIEREYIFLWGYNYYVYFDDNSKFKISANEALEILAYKKTEFEIHISKAAFKKFNKK